MLRWISIAMVSLLLSCNAGTNEKETETDNIIIDEPANAGMKINGVYHVHQLSAGGFAFQYKLQLMDNGEYKMFDKIGNYTYDPSTEIIKFTSGGIKDYNGVFTKTDHLNESRNLMMVLDFQGGIPDTNALGKKPGGYYQYAYYKGN